MPAGDGGNRNARFECVFVASPVARAHAVDREAFAEHFGGIATSSRSITSAATRCSWRPARMKHVNLAHLGEFAATASAVTTGCALEGGRRGQLAARIDAHPVWLSTAGHGVAWLHVRLDSQPKYYRYRPYVSR